MVGPGLLFESHKWCSRNNRVPIFPNPDSNIHGNFTGSERCALVNIPAPPPPHYTSTVTAVDLFIIKKSFSLEFEKKCWCFLTVLRLKTKNSFIINYLGTQTYKMKSDGAIEKKLIIFEFSLPLISTSKNSWSTMNTSVSISKDFKFGSLFSRALYISEIIVEHQPLRHPLFAVMSRHKSRTVSWRKHNRQIN